MQPLLRAGCKLLLGAIAGPWGSPVACMYIVQIDAKEFRCGVGVSGGEKGENGEL
jgi:hypothetical protein